MGAAVAQSRTMPSAFEGSVSFQNDGTTDLLSFRVDGDGPSLVSS